MGVEGGRIVTGCRFVVRVSGRARDDSGGGVASGELDGKWTRVGAG